MPDYRLYYFGPEGHIDRAVQFHSDSDEDAVAMAEGYGDGPRMELWQGSALVRSFSATEPAAWAARPRQGGAGAPGAPPGAARP